MRLTTRLVVYFPSLSCWKADELLESLLITPGSDRGEWFELEGARYLRDPATVEDNRCQKSKLREACEKEVAGGMSPGLARLPDYSFG